MKRLENLKKDILNHVNFEDYPENYIDCLSVKDTIINIFKAEAYNSSSSKTLSGKFVYWFCGLPTCFDYPIYEDDIKEIFKKYGYTENEIQDLKGSFNLEKLANLIFECLYY